MKKEFDKTKKEFTETPLYFSLCKCMNNRETERLKIIIEGSSHGEFVKGILIGYPQGIKVDYDFIDKEIERRKPQKYGTPRKEDDKVEFISGIINGVTDGTNIEFKINNNNVRKQDYDDFKGWFRPSHVDYPYYVKYKEDSLKYKDMASARMFLPVVVVGCFAKFLLNKYNISVQSYVVEVGGIDYRNNRQGIKKILDEVAAQGDTLGGKIKCEICGVGAGLGEPIFDKVSANLAKAVMSIPSCVSFSLGDMENRDKLKGSEDIDNWKVDSYDVKQGFCTVTNHSGGMNGGITNGMPIVFFAGFHPIHTLSKQMTLINEKGQLQDKVVGGRHDTCALLRTSVIVESVAAIVIARYIADKSDL